MKTNFKQTVLKLTLVFAFVLGIAGLGVNSYADTESATATATVIEPIAIANAGNLAFGKFARGAGGTVTVSTSGARTASGTILSTVGSTPTAAKFNVTGDNNATYSISFAGTSTALASVATPADTMAFVTASDFTAANTITGNVSTPGTLSASGAQSIYVGGLLTVVANQAAHTDYTGTISVTVEYN